MNTFVLTCRGFHLTANTHLRVTRDMIQNAKTRIVALPRAWKRAFLISFDFFVLATALWASFALRLDRWKLPGNIDE